MISRASVLAVFVVLALALAVPVAQARKNPTDIDTVATAIAGVTGKHLLVSSNDS